MPFFIPSHQGQKMQTFQKMLFFDLLGPAGVIFAVYALLAQIFGAGIPFGGFGRTRKVKCNMGCKKPPFLKNWLIYGIYGHIHRKGPIFTHAVRGICRVIYG